MIKFENVTKLFGGEVVLDEISFKLNKGDRCGIVGRNGSGKTTLLRIVTGEEALDGGVVDMPKGYSLGYLTQHLHFTKPTLIEEAEQNLPPHEIYKVEKILFGLGFKESDLESDPRTFSGGYQLRIHLAMVLAREPDCLLLDEPTNYLDIVSIRWITRFLKSWQGELLLISHDRAFMDQVTTHTLGIHRKKVKKFEGGTKKYYEQLLQEEEIYEQTRQNLEKKRAHVESFITRLGAKASKAAQAQSRKKQLDRMPVLEELAKLHHLDFKFPYSPLSSKQLIDASHLTFAYENMSKPLIDDFSLTIESGERIAIIGKNGRGKSTLLRLLAQEFTPQKGTIKVSPNVKIGFFGQSNIERLNPNMTIEEEIGSARVGMSISEVRKICGIMLFSGELAKKQISVLSGGERSRVLLGKILATSCNLLLLDEPTNHLDMESIEALKGAMEEFEGAIVIVSHSEMILNDIPNKFVICHQGNQHLFLGDYAQFLEKEGWEEERIPLKIEKPKEVHQHSRKKQIGALEKQIMRLESELEQEYARLIEASQKGEGKAIAELTRTTEAKKKQIDLLFNDLEKLE